MGLLCSESMGTSIVGAWVGWWQPGFPPDAAPSPASDVSCAGCGNVCPEACKEHQQRHGCHACDRIGCWTGSRTCQFYGRSRPSHVDASMGDNVPHMNETAVQIFISGAEFLKGARMRANWQRGRDVVVKVDGSSFHIGSASGGNMNCLIDTLRQVVAGGVDCNVQAVRDRIEREFHDVRPGDFLDLQQHWRAVIAWLARLNENGASFRADDFKVVCVDLLYIGNGDVDGCGTQTLHLARENANHFVPLFQIREPQRHSGAPEPAVTTDTPHGGGASNDNGGEKSRDHCGQTRDTERKSKPGENVERTTNRAAGTSGQANTDVASDGAIPGVPRFQL